MKPRPTHRLKPDGSGTHRYTVLLRKHGIVLFCGCPPYGWAPAVMPEDEFEKKYEPLREAK